ncbi:hypothetical protein SELMODRAFT_235206 [Selaginella moellendorffii]|uniref:Gamma-secretase subunit APH1-like n=1 Tax=Selaginella moellendorffii TaxID=88036 RepID=D8SV27_SELML|nr:hypothetical protein SELMODRAFT_235206 [Selaginella moellendorffii]
MTVASGVGYTLIALGPGFSLFFLSIVSKPLLILTLLASTLVWLASLVALAIVWRGFLPLGSSSWICLPLLASSVALQEFLRVHFWRTFKKVESSLNGVAVRISKPPLRPSEKIEIAIALGFGHGLAHSIMFCLSLLTPAFGPGTFYLRSCPQMPFFLVISVISLGFLLIHTFSMVIFFKGYEDHNSGLRFFVPAMHAVASSLTLVNLVQNGCVIGTPLVMLCAALTLFVCGKSLWQKGD